MISLLVSKIYVNKAYCMQTIKNGEQYCRQQLVNIVLVINCLILAPILLYILFNANIV